MVPIAARNTSPVITALTVIVCMSRYSMTVASQIGYLLTFNPNGTVGVGFILAPIHTMFHSWLKYWILGVHVN